MIPQQVAREVMTILRNNLTDPNTHRRSEGRNWIYTDMPRLDNTMPRMGIWVIGDTVEQAEIGSTTQLSRATLQISIFIKQKGKYEVESETKDSEYTLSHLGDQVIKTIMDNHDSLRTENIISVMPISDNTMEVTEGETNIYQKNLEFEIMLTR